MRDYITCLLVGMIWEEIKVEKHWMEEDLATVRKGPWFMRILGY